MTRSRRRKLAREQAHNRHVVLRRSVPVAATLLAAVPGAYAADEAAAEAGGLAEVVVTAQKRVENLQNVPISVQVLSGEQLEQLGIVNLDDYVKFAPSVSYQKSVGSSEGGNAEPGSSHTFIRGVVSGGDGNHSGSQPTVGTYLDEIPVTTIDGTVDMHLYDMQRIEVLEGPQGTLFGASSESGTIRLITNKPDASKFSAGYDVTGNYIVDHTGGGYELQGFVNIPITSWAAIRLVGWLEQDPGYISNVQGTDANGCIINGVRTFPTWAGQPAGSWSLSHGTGTQAPCPTPAPIGAGAITNAPWAANDYNTAIYRGGRGAIKFDLGDHWTVTPAGMAQNLTTKGFFGYDPAVGDLQLVHFGPESTADSWYLTSMTVEGKYNGWDIVDAGGYFKRTSHTVAEYSDYSEFYDRGYGSGAYWVGNGTTKQNTGPIMPQEYVIGDGYFEKWSNEFRVSTPADKPVRATFGFFIQRQLHNIWQNYTMPGYNATTVFGGNGGGASPNCCGFADFLSQPNFGNTIWLTDEQRVDRDKAGFIQASWDITDQWQALAGYRFYHYDNSLIGFYGFSTNYFGNGCGTPPAPPLTKYAPCTDLNNEQSNSGSVPKFTLTYKPTPDALIYATYSKGFRPGGANRVGAGTSAASYQADYLQNYELGWKTTWLNHHLRWNGAVFWENWDDFQFSFLVPPSITAVGNGGNATIKGLENSLEWAATDHLMMSTNFTFLNPYLTQNYCGTLGVTNCPTQQTYYAFDFPGAVKTPGGEYMWIGPQAPTGTNLPVVPKFKGNIVMRYTYGPINDWSPFTQAAFVYQTQTSPNLIVPSSLVIGNMPAYGLLDTSAGIDNGKMRVQLSVTNVTDKRAQISRFTETNPQVDNQVYIAPSQPRTISLNFSQKF
ncbi:MAG TPA: TonB-dependent receptor [Steroidobacteraceae bacterium]|jgi:outer membrane receptor protein involved in Fe transport|nr:TonB-dependent receptor [Steroidobacteraceae bacterium]